MLYLARGTATAPDGVAEPFECAVAHIGKRLAAETLVADFLGWRGFTRCEISSLVPWGSSKTWNTGQVLRYS